MTPPLDLLSWVAALFVWEMCWPDGVHEKEQICKIHQRRCFVAASLAKPITHRLVVRPLEPMPVHCLVQGGRLHVTLVDDCRLRQLTAASPKFATAAQNMLLF